MSTHAGHGDPHTHDTADIARARQDGATIAACTWLVERRYLDCDDLPATVIEECGAEAAYTDHQFWCAAGHEHTDAETRLADGWDYAEDAYDSAVITAGGRTYRPAGSGPSIDPAEVAHVRNVLGV
jgi:hypothetical protein